MGNTDGRRTAELMGRNHLAVATRESFEVKALDTDCLGEE
jgi:hypothetical protein